MAHVEKRGSKFTVRWRTLGGDDKRRSCPDAATAKALKLDIERSHALGREWEPAATGDEPAPTAPTIETVTAAYIARRALRVRPHTLRMDGMYLDVFKRFVVEAKGDTATVEILSRPTLDAYMEWLCRPDTTLLGIKARQRDTVGKYVRAVQQLWRWAEESDRWPGMVPRPRGVEDIPRSTPQPVVAPTWAEMDRCVLATKGWQRALVLWLRYTGLRVGESMLIEWRDIDMERGTLVIRPEIDKTKVGRIVPLSPHLIDEISTWGKREGFVIPCGRRPGPREREARSRDVARAWKRAGVREQVWQRRPDHAFRKGIKSGLLALGCHPDAIDYLQGHNLGAGSRGRYIDPWTALPLVEVVAKIPPSGQPMSNVIALPQSSAA